MRILRLGEDERERGWITGEGSLVREKVGHTLVGVRGRGLPRKPFSLASGPPPCFSGCPKMSLLSHVEEPCQEVGGPKIS